MSWNPSDKRAEITVGWIDRTDCRMESGPNEPQPDYT